MPRFRFNQYEIDSRVVGFGLFLLGLVMISPSLLSFQTLTTLFGIYLIIKGTELLQP